MKGISKETIQRLKIFFIPCEDNNYEPKVLDARFLFVFVMFLAILKFLILPVFSFFGQSIFYASVNKDTLIALVNEDRVKNSLAPLKENQTLDRTAELKAQNMFELGYFSHNSPTGTTPWYWFKQTGYNYKTAGENLAIGFIESLEVFNAWKASPSHNANLLNPKFEEIGIAVIKGSFQGKETTLVVQSFGTQKTSAGTNTVKQETVTVTPTPKKETTPNPTTKPVITPVPTKVPTVLPSPTIVPTSTPTIKSSPSAIVKAEVKQTPTPKITPKTTATPVPTPAQTEEEAMVAGETKDLGSPKLLSLADEDKAIKENILFSFWKFMVTNYYDIIQRIIFYALIFMVITLLLNIFIKINIQRPALVCKAAFFIALLVGFFLLDKGSILQIIPHDMAIF